MAVTNICFDKFASRINVLCHRKHHFRNYLDPEPAWSQYGAGLSMRLNRRSFVAGVTALAAKPARVADATSPIGHGVLAQNSLALAFEPVSAQLPDINVMGLNDRRSIRAIKGRTILMPLWAEWCAPCMSELPDFARLQAKYGNDKFAIVPVLTATQKAFTPESLQGLFKVAHLDIFEPLIESGRGRTLMDRMGRMGNVVALPCNLLIAPDGQVIAREMGRIPNSDDTNPAKSYKETLARMDANMIQSRWGQADGEQFAAAMADGFMS